jgi:anthranilate/para-aminobenzoate synthase component I
VWIHTEFPFDFTGGYVGYLGYELMAITEHVEGRSSQLPNAQLLFSDRFLAIDHLEGMLYLVALHDGDPSRARNWIESTGRSTKVCAVKALPCESCDLPAQCSTKVSVARQEPLPGKHCAV